MSGLGSGLGGAMGSGIQTPSRKMDALIATDTALAEEIDVLKRQLQD